jgi:hypothetical protein
VRDHVVQDVVRARPERAAEPQHGFGGTERLGERLVVGDVRDPRGEQALA